MVQHLQDVDQESQDRLMTARAILAVATNPDVSLSLTEIAMHSGMTVEAVRRVLNSPTYQQLFDEEIRHLVSRVLTRGIKAMDKIVHDEKSSAMAKVAAHRANISAFQALAGRQAPPDDSDEQTRRLLIELERIGKETNKA